MPGAPTPGGGPCNCGCNVSLWGVTATIISIIALCLAVAALIVVTSGGGNCRFDRHGDFSQPYVYAQPGGLGGSGYGGPATGAGGSLGSGVPGTSSGSGAAGKSAPQPQPQPQVSP